MPKLNKVRGGRMAQKRAQQQGRTEVSGLEREAERHVLNRLPYGLNNAMGTDDVRDTLSSYGYGSVNTVKLLKRLKDDKKIDFVKDIRKNRIFEGWYIPR